MSTFVLNPGPTWTAVFREQVRSVGIAIRRLVWVAGVLLTGITILLASEVVRGGAPVPMVPDTVPAMVVLSALFGIAVWREDYRFPNSFLAGLPVGRTGHALVKMAAGWVWLMVLVATFLLWVLALARWSGGQIGIDEPRLFMDSLPATRLLEEVETFERQWTTQPWHWLVFLTNATAAYLMGTAVVLVSPRTRWALAGLIVLCFFLIVAADNEFMYLGPLVPFFETVVLGPYGLKTLVTGYDGFNILMTAGDGSEVQVWTGLPRLATWLKTVAIWNGVGAVGVLGVLKLSRKD